MCFQKILASHGIVQRWKSDSTGASAQQQSPAWGLYIKGMMTMWGERERALCRLFILCSPTTALLYFIDLIEYLIILGVLFLWFLKLCCGGDFFFVAFGFAWRWEDDGSACSYLSCRKFDTFHFHKSAPGEIPSKKENRYVGTIPFKVMKMRWSIELSEVLKGRSWRAIIYLTVEQDYGGRKFQPYPSQPVRRY